MVDDVRTMATRLLTMKEASEILRVEVKAVQRWCKEGIVKSYRINASGHRLVSESSVKALAAGIAAGDGLARSS